jgi:YD repeat-containing protein
MRSCKVSSADRTLAYDYYLDGAVKRKTLADGKLTGDFVYDLAGRLQAIANVTPTPSGEPASYISTTAYNARGQTTSITYGNGVTSTYGYNDARGFVTRIMATNGATTLMDQTYRSADTVL